jgi:HK97 family phage prohead protease
MAGTGRLVAETSPGGVEGTERLHEYWVHGEGAAKIAWGAPGDFDRCVAHLGKYIRDPAGYCNLAHKAALGFYPATHAKMIEGRGAVVAQENRAAMSAADQNDLPDDAFAFIEPGGTKDASGKTTPRSLRHFPVHDAAHVRNALARAPQSPFGEKAMPKIRAAAAKLGVHVGGDSDGDSESRVYEWLPLTTGAQPEMRGVDPSGAPRIGGYAAVFGKLSRPLRQGPIKRTFVETVAPEAFNEARARGWRQAPEPFSGFSEGVLCRMNHKDDQILGRVPDTLELVIDNVGLDYTCIPPAGHPVIAMVERRHVQASSFMFECPPGGDSWDLTEQEFPMRTLHTVDLIDVAPTTAPAYPSATAGLRSLATFFGADYSEVRSMAEAGELRKFFIRTDNRGPVKAAPLPTGPQAMMRLMEKRFPKV